MWRPAVELRGKAWVELSVVMPRWEIHREEASLKVKTQLPRVFIDAREQWNELGCKTSLELSRAAAALGQEKVLAGITRMAQEGDLLADGHPVTELPDPSQETKDINVDIWPHKPPKITVAPGRVAIDFTPERLLMRPLLFSPRVEVRWEPLANHIDVYA
ncbi:MAG: hypothetical protein GX182_08825 [Firmicutes bacterium]|jgi:hypothetical protein|nr:hypothetical protein [Bacillota bacterium]